MGQNLGILLGPCPGIDEDPRTRDEPGGQVGLAEIVGQFSLVLRHEAL